MDELTTFEENNEIKPKPLKPELSTPLNPWIEIWLKVRQRGLYPDLTSFLFKLMHRITGILPTVDRVSRILPNSSSFCARCDGSIVEDLEHVMVHSQANGDIGHTVLSLVAHLADVNIILSIPDILTFNFEGSTDDLTLVIGEGIPFNVY